MPGKIQKNISGLIYSMSMSVPLLPPIVPVTIRELLGLPEEVGASELRSAAGNMARSIEKVFPLDPEHLLTRTDLEKLSDDSLKRFSLLSCSLTDKSILLVHSTLITEEWLKENKLC
jgi:hypothetical protein